jgi:hypothetical protein
MSSGFHNSNAPLVMVLYLFTVLVLASAGVFGYDAYQWNENGYWHTTTLLEALETCFAGGWFYDPDKWLDLYHYLNTTALWQVIAVAAAAWLAFGLSVCFIYF